ncbi:hypothetical protein MD484_g3848, partial [Candolleomyces efflorescens]
MSKGLALILALALVLMSTPAATSNDLEERVTRFPGPVKAFRMKYPARDQPVEPTPAP